MNSIITDEMIDNVMKRSVYSETKAYAVAVKQLRAENARLREALGIYKYYVENLSSSGPRSSVDNYGVLYEQADNWLHKDCGEIARAALNISTPSTQAENVSKNSEEIEG